MFLNLIVHQPETLGKALTQVGVSEVIHCSFLQAVHCWAGAGGDDHLVFLNNAERMYLVTSVTLDLAEVMYCYLL